MSIFQNQRADVRTRINGKISYSRTDGGDCYDAQLFDCCANGLGFITKYPYLKETQLFLESRNGLAAKSHQVSVAWSNQFKKFSKSHPQFRIGVTFS